MYVDHERAWIALKEVIVAKRSHGQRDLLTAMARIEVESVLDEDSFDPRPLPPRRNGKPSRAPASLPESDG